MIYQRKCVNCAKKYQTQYVVQRHCSKECAGVHKTKRRYLKESGNWDLYFKQLLSKGRKSRSRLTPKSLLKLAQKQNYKCALSGVDMTCIKKIGVTVRTNASIDRIDAKGAYNIRNIQLVCTAVNSFRTDLSVDEFINWCNKVTDHASKEKKL